MTAPTESRYVTSQYEVRVNSASGGFPKVSEVTAALAETTPFMGEDAYIRTMAKEPGGTLLFLVENGRWVP